MKTVLFHTICLLLMGSLYVLKAQNVITVDNALTNAADYTSLQAAIDAASNGDIIYVQPSETTYGNINVTKPLTIIGRSWRESGYITYTNTFNIQSSDVHIKGLHIQNGLNIQAASNTQISNITVKECRAGLVAVGASYPVSQLDLQGNRFDDRLHLYANATNVMVRNCIIIGEVRTYHPETLLFTQNILYASALLNYGEANSIFQISNSIFYAGYYQGTSLSTSGRFKIQNSLTWNAYYGTYNIANAGSPLNAVENCILSTNPQFVDANNNNYNLNSNSPAVGSGLEGKNMGIYQDYSNSLVGNPVGYPTLTIDAAPSSVSAGADLEVTVTAEAH